MGNQSGNYSVGSKIGYDYGGGAKEDVGRARAQASELERQAGAAGNRGLNYFDTSNREYNDKNALRNELLGNYRGLYAQAGADSGGGVGAFIPGTYLENENLRMNEAMEGYRELSRTGGWTPEQIASAQSIATASGEGLYQGLKNQMMRASSGSGVPVYSSTLGKMSRAAAQESNRANAEANLGIQADIRNRKETGLTGVSSLDTEFMNRQEKELGSKRAFTEQETNRRQSHASAAAGAASGNARRRRAEQAGYLSDLGGLLKTYENVPYANLSEGAYDAQTGATRAINPYAVKGVL